MRREAPHGSGYPADDFAGSGEENHERGLQILLEADRAAGAGLLALVHRGGFSLEGGVEELVAAGTPAGAAVHHRWPGGPSAIQRVYSMAEWPCSEVQRGALPPTGVGAGSRAVGRRRVYRAGALGALEGSRPAGAGGFGALYPKPLWPYLRSTRG